MNSVTVMGIPPLRGGDVPVSLFVLLGSLWNAHA